MFTSSTTETERLNGKIQELKGEYGRTDGVPCHGGVLEYGRNDGVSRMSMEGVMVCLVRDEYKLTLCLV